MPYRASILYKFRLYVKYTVMINRALWLDRIQQAWTQRSIVWLSGVRRVGKTTLARMLPDAFTPEKAGQLDADVELAERVDAFVSRFGRLQDTVALLP